MYAPRSIIFIFSTLMLTLFAAAACETAPPVQEMSDARQAIEVAREAGAADLAAVELAEAVQYLESAEKRLNDQAYREARQDALQAKSKALHALEMSESSKESGSD